MRLGIGLILMMLLASGLHAAPMSEQQVATATETWLQKVITESRPGATAARMEPHVVDGQTVAYIAHLARGGYCLCGADDLLLPVYLYVPRGEYEPANPNLEDILLEIASRLSFVQESLAAGDSRLDEYQDDLADRLEMWRDLAAGQVPARILAAKDRDGPVLMKLPLTSEWDQNSPYNSQCPTMPGETPSVVGCVATAMSQIMNYWEWPASGTGSHNVIFNYSFTDSWLSEPLASDPGLDPAWSGRLQWTAADGGTLQMFGNWDISHYRSASGIEAHPNYFVALDALYSRLTPASQNHYANFAATSYDYDLIQDLHADPVGGDDDEVAKLCYHAGIAIDMNWGMNESGAFTSRAGDVLEQFFRYDPDNIFGVVDKDIMVEEIQWMRPVQIRGGSSSGGHSWVIVGYDLADPEHPSFWMNMGWGAWANGWYALDEVPLNIVFDQQHVSMIAPEGVVRFIGHWVYANADGSPANPYSNMSEALTEIPDNGTLIFKAGTNLMWTSGGVVDRPMTLKGVGATISAQ